MPRPALQNKNEASEEDKKVLTLKLRTFEQLSQEEKSGLLKTVAIQLGLIAPS